jgi:hypothetical protein
MAINDNKVFSWLRHNSVSIKTIEAGNSFENLEPIKETLKDVKIVF